MDVDSYIKHHLDTLFFKKYTLSKCEKLVFAEAIHGCSSNEMADRICISPKTVKFHLTKIFSKLGVRNKNELTTLFFKDFAAFLIGSSGTKVFNYWEYQALRNPDKPKKSIEKLPMGNKPIGKI